LQRTKMPNVKQCKDQHLEVLTPSEDVWSTGLPRNNQSWGCHLTKQNLLPLLKGHKLEGLVGNQWESQLLAMSLPQ
jgi:hypothetical protein